MLILLRLSWIDGLLPPSDKHMRGRTADGDVSRGLEVNGMFGLWFFHVQQDITDWFWKAKAPLLTFRPIVP